MIPKLDSALSHYHDKIEVELHKRVKDSPGSGAAGGMGTALLAFLDAKLQPGIELVLEETHFQERVKDAHLVITGEGQLDKQTIYGKTPIGVAKSAKVLTFQLSQFAVVSEPIIKQCMSTALIVSLVLLNIHAILRLLLKMDPNIFKELRQTSQD